MRAQPGPRHPAAKLRFLLPKAISIAEVNTILESVATDTPAGLRDRALLEFLYSTGARISEVVALDVDDVHFAAGLQPDADLQPSTELQAAPNPGSAPDSAGQSVVRLFGKGSKERVVPIAPTRARRSATTWCVPARGWRPRAGATRHCS